MREKVVLIGAGSAMFTRGLVTDLIELGQDLDLALVDIDDEALEIASGLARKMISTRQAPITLSASLDRRQALHDASVVICTIGVGGRRAWEQDVFIPRRFGIYQPVGDSVMPGGSSRALRMIPAMVAIAEDVVELAPAALFFNYGNPMAPVCRAVRKATDAQMVGLCHGVFHVASHLADLLGIEPQDLYYRGVGVNHLTWFLEVRERGQDVMPRLRSIGRETLEKVSSVADAREVDVEALHPFSWELLELFGAFPAVLDRHVTEFFPGLFPGGRYYGRTLGVDAYSLERTIARGDEIHDQMKAHALSPDPLPEGYFQRSSGEHEQVVDILQSIRQGRERTYSVNLPNRGQVPNLPHEAIVESAAVADATGLHPIVQPPLPSGIVGTLATRLAWVETIVEAALEGSRQKFEQALVLDGAVDSVDTAGSLAGALLEAQAEFLPQF